MDKSTSWKYNIDLNEIEKIEEKDFESLFKIIKAKEEDIMKTEISMQHNSMFSDNYRPLFIEDMSEDKLKEFSLMLSNKLRYIKLSMAKSELNQQKYNDFQKKEKNRKTLVPLAKSQIVKSSRKFLEPLKIVGSNKKIRSEYAYLPKRNMSPNENFERCKEDFNTKFQEIPIDELIKRRKQFLLPKICKTEENKLLSND